MDILRPEAYEPHKPELRSSSYTAMYSNEHAQHQIDVAKDHVQQLVKKACKEITRCMRISWMEFSLTAMNVVSDSLDDVYMPDDIEVLCAHHVQELSVYFNSIVEKLRLGHHLMAVTTEGIASTDLHLITAIHSEGRVHSSSSIITPDEDYVSGTFSVIQVDEIDPLALQNQLLGVCARKFQNFRITEEKPHITPGEMSALLDKEDDHWWLRGEEPPSFEAPDYDE